MKLAHTKQNTMEMAINGSFLSGTRPQRESGLFLPQAQAEGEGP